MGEPVVRDFDTGATFRAGGHHPEFGESGESRNSAIVSERHTRMGKILIVDDDPDVRMVLATTLEEAGHEIEEASDGLQVLDMARKTSPDAILLDINMPGMDGFQALEQLKSHRDSADIPVIMISARARPKDREDALFMGAVDYVTKPWSEGEVELRVDWVLNQRSKNGAGRGSRIEAGEEITIA